MPDGRTFLLEVGCEEIPAPMIPKALDDLAAAVRGALGPLAPGATASNELGGPRRLVTLIRGVAEREPDRQETITGPPKSAAFDARGEPTRAALGFAKGQGVAVADLLTVATPKGEVLAARKAIVGRTADEILAGALPSILGAMRFGKMMRWGDRGHFFVRPVQWILALLDGAIIPFEFMGVRSGRATRGHRFLGAGPHEVASAVEYENVLREKGQVVVSISERRRILLDLAAREAKAAGGTVRPDPDLVEELIFLTEHPALVRGSFDPEYLALPDAVLLTTMRHHQKYLTVDGHGGRVTNAFLAVLTTDNDAQGLIRRGNEWVLRARLADAKFFFEEDRKRSLEARVGDLERVSFHARLGTYATKVERMGRMAGEIAATAPDGSHEGDLDLALRLCKVDLTTHMVGEFPELQGVMGGIYARLEGLPEGTARAMEEHYLPASATGPLPSRGPASILALADKIDTLVQCFGAGLVPKGSSDPYGLRRAALGVLRILVENGMPLDLEPVLRSAFSARGAGVLPSGPDAAAALSGFFRQRLQFLMEESGIRFDAARAALAAGSSVPVVAWRRAGALNGLRGEDDFLALAAAAKRVRNILAQAKEKNLFDADAALDAARLQPGAETELHGALVRARGRASELAGTGDHAAALKAIASLRPQVDLFFDRVLVMDPDEKTRANRLALLADLQRLLSSEADFAEIVVEGEAEETAASTRSGR
ncbi:MAG: glycine--tRNA ligase subunit beta [Acidobacteria bacterium]|nr:glycine--tRNA ligase subunit beta [Acidobacteriota bacterium]